MATVHIPAALRELTGGETNVTVPGETLREVLDRLDETYPGLKSRLVQGERLVPGMAVFVDGAVPAAGLRARLSPEAEIYFAPAIAGGRAREVMSHRQTDLEIEVALVLCAADAAEVTRQIASLPEIAGYQLLVRGQEWIHDTYLDTTDHSLDQQKLSLRIREADGKRKLTLKGPGQPADGGAEARLEIEAPWSREAVARVDKELADRQISMPGQISDIDLTRPLDALAGMGLQLIQDRITERQLRNIVSMSNPQSPVLAELAIDHVLYHFDGHHVGFYEVEIESKHEDSSAALRAVTDGLLERYSQALRRWSYSKVVTGQAIEKLISQRLLGDLLDAKRHLKPSAFDRIDDLLKRGDA